MTTTPNRSRPAGDRPQWQRELAKVLEGFVIHRNGEPDFDRAGLAACRRGLAKRPMEEPAMFQYIAPVSLAVPASWGEQAQARVEAATHYVLALYAFHQQSQDRPMHQFSDPQSPLGWPGPSVGKATGRLHSALKDGTAEGVDRRFLAAMTADSTEEVIGHLRVLVPQLRRHAIALDYIMLAGDLEQWPDSERRARVRRRWGLDYRWVPSGADDSGPDDASQADHPDTPSN
ncbi:type I-E CRISPR-associated protein Cse2/CasB [Actinomadura gamaensis]|uniref:Type I-E CRISPR-associated protein Cse2/CasB n=1 Tax=Actinomadura gamaensis TaxID=1763541 RepID=A0ABV9TRY6_9ACTN